jgi:charged multivesicular body protein 1
MFGRSKEELIDEQLYNLKYMSKSLTRTAKRYKDQEKTFYRKAKNALRQGDERTATTFARQSIQYSNLALKSTNLACNLEIVEARVKESVQMGRMNDDIMRTVALLTSHLQPLSSIDNIGIIDKSFEDVLVYTQTLNNMMDGVVASSENEPSRTDQTNLMSSLREEIANESSLEFMTLPSINTSLLTNQQDKLTTKEKSYF